MVVSVDWVKESTGTTGTGVITLAGALSGYSEFQEHTGITDGVQVYYTIRDGVNFEKGIGTWNTGNTLTRTTVTATLVSGTLDDTSPTAISLSGSAIVGISPTQDMFDAAAELLNDLSPQLGANLDVNGFDIPGFATDAEVTAKADLASPTFTGVPAAPTASLATNTTQLATTAFVQANSILDISEDTTPTLGGSLSGNDELVNRIKLFDWGEVVQGLGTFGATEVIDLTLGNSGTGTVSIATTVSFSNPTALATVGFILYLTNGAAATVTWDSSIDWSGGTAPTLTASGLDILVFTTHNDGTTWHGQVAALDTK